MEFTRRGGQHGVGDAVASCHACLLAKDFGVASAEAAASN